MHKSACIPGDSIDFADSCTLPVVSELLWSCNAYEMLIVSTILQMRTLPSHHCVICIRPVKRRMPLGCPWAHVWSLAGPTLTGSCIFWLNKCARQLPLGCSMLSYSPDTPHPLILTWNNYTASQRYGLVQTLLKHHNALLDANQPCYVHDELAYVRVLYHLGLVCGDPPG